MITQEISIFLIANDLKLSHKKVVGVYMQHWDVEREFQELKDSFHFDHDQVRHKEKIMHYWRLCTLVFSLIYWIKLNGCFTKVLNYSPSTFNDYKVAPHKFIRFSSPSYLSKDSVQTSSFLLILNLNALKINLFITDF